MPGTLSRLSHVSPALPLSTRVSFIVTHSLARPRAITALLPFYTNPLTPRFLFTNGGWHSFLYLSSSYIPNSNFNSNSNSNSYSTSSRGNNILKKNITIKKSYTNRHMINSINKKVNNSVKGINKLKSRIKQPEDSILETRVYNKDLNHLPHDYKILYALNIDFRSVTFHKNIVTHDNVIKSWQYGSQNYYNVSKIVVLANKIILSKRLRLDKFGDPIISKHLDHISLYKKFFKSEINLDDAVYAIIPVIVLIKPVNAIVKNISLTSQIVVTKHADTAEFHNVLLNGTKKLVDWYKVGYLAGDLIFKWRIISYNKDIAVKINNTVNLNELKVNITNTMSKDFKYTDDNLPNSFYKKYLGMKIIKNDFDYRINNNIVKGSWYKFKDDVRLFLHANNNDPNIRKITVFKDRNKFNECTEYFNKENRMIKRVYTNGIEAFINTRIGVIEYINKPIYSTPLKVGGSNDLSINIKFSTFDIETYLNDKHMFIPYACGYIKHDKNSYNAVLYYLTSFDNPEQMLKKCLIDMLNDNLGIVYVHNLSRFDTIFIDKIIITHPDLDYDYKFNRNYKILSIKLSYKKDYLSKLECNKTKDGNIRARFKFNPKLIIMDSKLMIPGSLKSISDNFDAVYKKSDFCHDFANEKVLEYIGRKPQRKYFEGISYAEYIKINTYNWDFKKECKKYLELDLKSLYEVLKKFALDIFNMECLNITKTPSISSLAFKALTTNYFRRDELFKISGFMYHVMRNGLYGGICENYILHSRKGLKIYVYDIKSSYPSSMNKPMPVGKPVYSNENNLDSYFGVVFVEVETPKINGEYVLLKHPPLPFRLDDGTIINPVGRWRSTYCSELVKYVRDFYGYTVKVIYGFKFNKGYNVFGDFPNKYYDIKNGVNTSVSISRPTAKLLLNSGFGRTALKIDGHTIKLLTHDMSKHIQLKHHTRNVIPMTDDVDIVSYDKHIINDFYIDDKGEGKGKPDDSNQDYIINNLKESDKEHDDIEQCFQLAIFITAYSSIKLFEAIRSVESRGGNVYYVDTDSISTDLMLDENLTGDKLGDWNLEFIADKAYFPLPKFYYMQGKSVKNGKILDKKCVKCTSKGLSAKSVKPSEYRHLTYVRNSFISKREKRFIIKREEHAIYYDYVNIKINSDIRKRRYDDSDKKGFNTKPFIVIDNEIIK